MSKTVSAGMNTHIQGSLLTLATLWRCLRVDGQTFNFTDHDHDIQIDDGEGLLTYQKDTSMYRRTAIQGSAGMAVDNLNVEAAFHDAGITLVDLQAGRWDFAEIKMSIVNFTDLTDGVIKTRRGTLGELRSTDTFNAELRGMFQPFIQEIVEVITPTCRADVYDARCGAVIGDFTMATDVATVSDRRVFTVSDNVISGGPTVDDASFTGGTIKMTSGLNNGLVREVKIWVTATKTVTMFQPLPHPVAVSDTCDLRFGCDKTLAICRDVFDRVADFRGEPYVPGNDKLTTG